MLKVDKVSGPAMRLVARTRVQQVPEKMRFDDDDCFHIFLGKNNVVRPSQSMIYVPLLVNRFQKSVLLIVQYKYSKFCSGDLIFPIWGSEGFSVIHPSP